MSPIAWLCTRRVGARGPTVNGALLSAFARRPANPPGGAPCGPTGVGLARERIAAEAATSGAALPDPWPAR